MDFVIQWLCYLFAFLAGSAVACTIAPVVLKRSAGGRVPVPGGSDGVGAAR